MYCLLWFFVSPQRHVRFTSRNIPPGPWTRESKTHTFRTAVVIGLVVPLLLPTRRRGYGLCPAQYNFLLKNCQIIPARLLSSYTHVSYKKTRGDGRMTKVQSLVHVGGGTRFSFPRDVNGRTNTVIRFTRRSFSNGRARITTYVPTKYVYRRFVFSFTKISREFVEDFNG